MKKLLRSNRPFFAMATFALALAPFQLSASIIPVTATYQFIGACAPNDCTGEGTGTLTLTNYTLGTALDKTNFVSFSYSSNLITIDIDSSSLSFFAGSIASSLPAASYVNIQGSDPSQAFVSLPNGAWCGGIGCGQDNGLVSTWSAAAAPVPEPGMFLPVAGGILGLALSRRRLFSN
jgi:hypothetical protein